MTKLIILSIATILYCSKQRSEHQKGRIKPVVVELMFQDYFKNDTISLKVNNVSIVDKILLTSNTAGFTILNIKLSQLIGKRFKLSFLDQYRYCHSTNILKLEIILNGNISKIEIDRRKGKYVGLNKNDHNALFVKQQKVPFIYD